MENTGTPLNTGSKEPEYFFKDLKCAFAYWVFFQTKDDDIQKATKAISAYVEYLRKRYFKSDFKSVDFQTMLFLTSEDLFIAIPEIYDLNEIDNDGFVDLGALSRNVRSMVRPEPM